MAFNINDFKAILTGGGARPTLFRVEIDMPFSDSTTNRKLTFTAKAASLPPSDLETITVPYFGRQIKVAGDRTFPEWSLTIINDEDFIVKDALERWNQSINSHIGNLNESGGPVAYKQRDGIVKQYAKTGQLIRQYDFKNLFPSNIAAIDLSWETTNTIEEYTVTFQYDYWELTGPGAGGRSAAGINRLPEE
jgi:hypothetical protein